MVGFSFKMLKTGTRYTPGFAHHGKNLPKDAGERRAPLELHRCDRAEGCQMENGVVLSHSSGIEGSLLSDNEVAPMQQSHKKRRREVATVRSESPLGAWKPQEPSLRKLSCDAESSFAVNLLPDGFSIEKPTEEKNSVGLMRHLGKMRQMVTPAIFAIVICHLELKGPNQADHKKGQLPAPAYEVMDFLYPYDRTSETFLRAIDGGWLPGDLLEDIPCKYFDGCVICELRDYRDSIPSTIENAVPPISCKGALGKWMPVVQRVLLQPSTETIVKDMASIVDNSWTYRELLEVEARVLRAIQPSLCLNPGPEVGKLASANTLKFNVGCSALGRYRSPNEVFRDRRLRISAAARAQLKAKWLVQRRTSSSLQIAETPVSVLSTPSLPESPVADAEPVEETVKWSTPQARGAGHAALFRPAPPSAISIPSSPLSPNSSTPATPATPATPSTLTSASGHEATSGALGRTSPMLEFREDKENGATASVETKSFNLEQAKVEKLQTLQQKVHEETEAKDLTKKQLNGKQQHLYQNRLEKQQRVSEILIHFHSHAPQTPQQPEGALQEKDILPTFLEIKTALANDEPQEPGIGKSIVEQQDSSASLEQTFSEGPEIAKIQQESEDQDQAIEKNYWQAHKVEGPEREQDQYHEEQGARHQEQPLLLQQWPILTSHYWQQLGSSNPNVIPSSKAERVQTFTEELLNFKQRCHLPVKAPQRTSKLPLKFDTMTQPTQPMLLTGYRTSSSTCPLTNLRAVPLMPTALTAFASERAHTQVMASSAVGSSENMKQVALVPQMPQLHVSRRRSSSPPKFHLLASPRILHSVAAGTRRVCNSAIKVEQSTLVHPHMLVPQQSKVNVDTQASLLAAIQRHGLHKRKKPVEQLPPPNRTPPSFHMMSVALSDTQEDVKETKDQGNMASLLVGGNVNSRKTRFLQFTKTEHTFRGFGYPPALHHMQKRLVLCGRVKDSLVEAIVQMDDTEDEASSATPHHHVLPTMANAHVADRFAKQYCALLEKEGYELTADEVHLSASRGSSSSFSSGHHVPTPTSSVDNPLTGNLGASQNSVSCPLHLQFALSSTLTPVSPMPSSLSQMSTNPMPPPQSASNRQILSNSLKVTSLSKPTELDATTDSQLQTQQLQQHHQMQQQPTHQLAQLAAQLTGQTLDPREQIKPQMVTHSIQYHQLQYHLHQQAQWQQHHQMLQQRKILLPGSLPSLSTMGGVGIQMTRAQSSLASMKSMAMGGLNTMGLSSFGGMSGLALGSLGQSNNMMGQHLRSVAMGQSQIAAAIQASKGGERLNTVPNPFVRTTSAVDRFSGLGNVAQMMTRSGLAPIQRAAVAGIAPPQSYYLNPPQLNARQLNVGSLSAVVGGPPSPHSSSHMSSGNLVGLDLQNVTRVPERVPHRRPGVAQIGQQGQNPQ